ncbi:MAG: hypothetical protein HOC71_14820 [Candidatus Latescibacteria bacterium]|jgi:hypothetical protein|nr:hypothetical protein [Candidatus Latescibacterota bacterium]
MRNRNVRAVVFTAALLLSNKGSAQAEFSANALIGYLTGIPRLADFSGDGYKHEHPAGLADEYKPFIETTGIRHEVVRSLNGEKKNVVHGMTSLGFKQPLLSNRAGVYLSYADNQSSVEWPFSKDRLIVDESYGSGRICLSAFTSARKTLQAGITVGRQVRGGGDEYLQIIEVSGRIPTGVCGSVRYYSMPYEWGIGINYDNISKMLPSRFRYSGFESNISWSVAKNTCFTLSAGKRMIDTPKTFRGMPGKHAQVWDGNGDNWKVSVRRNVTRSFSMDVSYGKDAYSQEMDLWYNRSQYGRGILEGDTYSFEVKAKIGKAPRYIPDILYNHISADLALSRGIVDSWPFTPKQIEIIGDKTWTFSGTGRIASDSGTFLYEITPQSGAALSYVRVYFDYRLRITTRDHLSTNPMDMIFGRKRVETDLTRYYDFISVMYRKEFNLSFFPIAVGIQQLIPVRHAEKKIPGKAPVPPSFPKVRFARPKRFGGLSAWIRVKYYI